jgi:hypothetical protein
VNRLAVLLLPVVLACGPAPARDAAQEAAPVGGAASGEPGPPIMALADVPRSQPGSVSQRVANTDITVTYSRPVARGRTLFGELVPYGEPWNPGANDATAATFSRDVRVNGQPLAAGSYSIWVIPRPDDWTVIFSRAADVFHTPYPGESEDALRLQVTPQAGPHAEVLTFSFPLVEGKDAVLQLQWGTVAVPLAIAVP